VTGVPNSAAGLAFADHDHAACSGSLMSRAEDLARARRMRLTPVRRRALEILLSEHRALGAYEVLDRLAESGFPRQPPVAYRALEFLVEMGLAHRIDALNAFAACMHPGERHEAAFLICRTCGALAEVPAGRVRAALEGAAAGTGFRVERASLEAVGLCPGCAAGAGA
jgi:Fur family transcriptional regulator, zinc uptake regulator